MIVEEYQLTLFGEDKLVLGRRTGSVYLVFGHLLAMVK